MQSVVLGCAVVQRISVKKVFLEISQNSQENTCARVFFLIKLLASGSFIKKETLAQVFSCEFCEISKNTVFHKRPLVAASERKDDPLVNEIYGESAESSDTD